MSEVDISQYLPEPYTATITFNDDSVVEGTGSVDFERANLWLWPTENLSFGQLAVIFEDPNKTSKITCRNTSTSEEIYFSYTYLADIKKSPDGRTAVCMKRPLV